MSQLAEGFGVYRLMRMTNKKTMRTNQKLGRRHTAVSQSVKSVSLTERLKDGDARASTATDGVVSDYAFVGGAVEHDAVRLVVVHDVVLDGDVVAPLRGDDAVVACGGEQRGQDKQWCSNNMIAILGW